MTHMHVQAPCSSSHHSTSAYQLHITTQHPLSTQPKSLYQTQQCFAHPSSRARAQLPLPVTSPHLPSEWQRELPAQDPQGLPDPLAVTPSPSASLLARSSSFAKKRRPSSWQSRRSSRRKGSTWRTWTSTSTMSLLSLSAQARASKSERFAMLRTNNAGRPIRR